jgi:hypothetical protein
MLHPSTGPVTLAVYARWGAGKVSFAALQSQGWKGDTVLYNLSPFQSTGR